MLYARFSFKGPSGKIQIDVENNVLQRYAAMHNVEDVVA